MATGSRPIAVSRARTGAASRSDNSDLLEYQKVRTPMHDTRPDLRVKKPLRKLTVLLEPELADALMSERARIAANEGVNVSLTSLATKAMRVGFDAIGER